MRTFRADPRPFLLAQDFAEMCRSMIEEDERREMLIKKSREVLKLSKNRCACLGPRTASARTRVTLAPTTALRCP